MNSHEQPGWQGSQGRNAQDNSGDYFGEADMSFGKAMVEQVKRLNDE